MIHDSNRRALRIGLPWVFVGFHFLVLAVGLWLLANREPEAHAGYGFASRLTGAIGSGLFLIGLLKLARARIARRLSPWFIGAFGLWLCELVLRLNELVVGQGTASVPAIRLLLACASVFCVSGGMRWVWDGRGPAAHERTWVATQRLMAVQLCATLSLLVAAAVRSLTPTEVFERITNGLPLGLGLPLVWLVFAGPYVHFFLSTRRTIQDVAKRVGVSELLSEGPR